MVQKSGSSVWQSTDELLMKTCNATPSWGGDPFADAMDRALWELGYPNDFDTEAEARAAIAEVLKHRPELARLPLTFTEVK
jgi:hypothetical protein